MRALVIYRLGSLGDTVVSLPCFHKIAESFPEHERIVLTNFPVSSKAAAVESILGGSGLVHRFLSYPVGTRSFSILWRLSCELRALNADTLIFLSEPRGLRAALRDFAFFRLSGIRRIIGAPLTADLQSYRGGDERECSRLARCLSPLGPIDVEDPQGWSLHLTPSEEAAAAAFLMPFGGVPFLVLHMGGKLAINDWGEANWRGLMAALASDYGRYGLLVLGAAEEAPRAQALAALWPGTTLDACGRLLPREAAAVLAKASLFIGHDSGPLHLASASLCSWVGIFGEHNPPKRWHPIIGRGEALHDMRGVASIGVEQVAEAVRRLL